MAVIVGAALLGPLPFILLFFVVTLATVLEFYRIISVDDIAPQRRTGAFICMVLFLFISYVSQDTYKLGFAADLSIVFKTPVLILALIYFMFFAELFRKRPRPFVNIGITVLGLFYIAIPFSMFCMMGLSTDAGAYSPQLALGFLVMLWVNDSGAYLAGSRFGKNKLFPKVSPGKTWEGTITGILAVVGAAWLWSRFFTRLSPAEWIGLSLVIAVTATLGDLVASMLKRSLSLKDSGTVFPGHGGFLDRFDGLLGAAPFAYLFLYLLNKL